MIQKFKANYNNDKMAKVLTAAVSKADLAEAAYSPADAAKMENCFSIDLHCGTATSQQASGRCWLFASMNVMREIIMKKCNIAHFELSGNYFAFWDKFEKINYCLESIINIKRKAPGAATALSISRFSCYKSKSPCSRAEAFFAL